MVRIFFIKLFFITLIIYLTGCVKKVELIELDKQGTFSVDFPIIQKDAYFAPKPELIPWEYRDQFMAVSGGGILPYLFASSVKVNSVNADHEKILLNKYKEHERDIKKETENFIAITLFSFFEASLGEDEYFSPRLRENASSHFVIEITHYGFEMRDHSENQGVLLGAEVSAIISLARSDGSTVFFRRITQESDSVYTLEQVIEDQDKLFAMYTQAIDSTVFQFFIALDESMGRPI